jgi:hypothetical protein
MLEQPAIRSEQSSSWRTPGRARESVNPCRTAFGEYSLQSAGASVFAQKKGATYAAPQIIPALLAAALTTATFWLRGLTQLAGQLIFECHALNLKGRKGVFVEQFNALFNPADTLIQRFILIGQAGKVVIFLTQAVQLFAQLGEVGDQWMVFYMHGTAPVMTDLRLAVGTAKTVDQDQQHRP